MSVIQYLDIDIVMKLWEWLLAFSWDIYTQEISSNVDMMTKKVEPNNKTTKTV